MVHWTTKLCVGLFCPAAVGVVLVLVSMVEKTHVALVDQVGNEGDKYGLVEGVGSKGGDNHWVGGI